MTNNSKYVVSILAVVFFYIYAIVEKVFGWTSYSTTAILRNNLLLICLVLGLLFLMHTRLNKEKLSAFFSRKEKFIIHLVLGLLLLSITYVIKSIEIVSYEHWFAHKENSEIQSSLKAILSNKLYAFFLLGPFVWLNETFGVLTRVFMMHYLWKLSSSKYWSWFSILLVSLLFAGLQVDKGWTEMITAFLIVTTSNLFYLKYRNAIPIIIAPVLYTTIDLIAFWVYNF